MKKFIVFFVLMLSFCSIVNAEEICYGVQKYEDKPLHCDSYNVRKAADCTKNTTDYTTPNCSIDKGVSTTPEDSKHTPQYESLCRTPIPHCPDPSKVRILFLIDDSYSMQTGATGGVHPRIAAVKKSIRHLLYSFYKGGFAKATVKIQYFSKDTADYNSGTQTLDEVAYDADSRKKITDNITINDFPPGGNTNFSKALDTAISFATAKQTRIPYIVFITDGYPNTGDPGEMGWLSSARYFYDAVSKMNQLFSILENNKDGGKKLANGQLITVGVDLGADDAMANYLMHPTSGAEGTKAKLTTGTYKSNESIALSRMLDGLNPDSNANNIEPAGQRYELIAGIGARPERGIVGYDHFNADGNKVVLFNNLMPLSGNNLGKLFVGPVKGDTTASTYSLCTLEEFDLDGDKKSNRVCFSGAAIHQAGGSDNAFFVEFNVTGAKKSAAFQTEIANNKGWLFSSSSSNAWSFRSYTTGGAIDINDKVYRYFPIQASSLGTNYQHIDYTTWDNSLPPVTYTYENKRCCKDYPVIDKMIYHYNGMCADHSIDLKTLNNGNPVTLGGKGGSGTVSYILLEHIGFNGGSLMAPQTAVPGSGFSMKNLFFTRGFDIDFAVEGGPYGTTSISPAVLFTYAGDSTERPYYANFNSIDQFSSLNRESFKSLIKRSITENFDVGFDDVKTVDSNDASNLNYVINDHLEKEENAVSTTHYYDFSKSESAHNHGSSIKPAYTLHTNGDIADVRHSSALGGWLCSRTYNNVHKSSTYLEFNDIDYGRGSYSGPDYKYGFAILDMHKHGNCSAPTTSYYPTGSSDSHYPIDYYYETLEVKFSMDMLSRESIGGSSAAIDDDPSGKKDFIIGNWETYGGGIYLNNGEIRANLYIEDGVDNGYKVISSGIKAEVRRMYTVRLEYYGEKMLLYINGKKAGELVVRGKIRQPNGRDLEGHYVSGRVTSMALGCNPKGDGCSPTVPFARMRVHSVMISGVSDSNHRESSIRYTTRSDVYRIKTANYDANAGNKNGLFCYGSTCGSSYKEVSPNFYNYYYVPFNYKSDKAKIFISASSVATGQKVSTECKVNVEGEISNPTKKVNYRSVNVSEPFPRQTSNYREVPYNWYLYYYCNNIINDVNGCKSFNGAARDRIKSSYDQSKKHYTINLGKDDLSGMSNFNFFYKSDIKLYNNGSSKFISGNPMFTQPSGNDKYCEIGRWSSVCDRY